MQWSDRSITTRPHSEPTWSTRILTGRFPTRRSNRSRRVTCNGPLNSWLGTTVFPPRYSNGWTTGRHALSGVTHTVVVPPVFRCSTPQPDHGHGVRLRSWVNSLSDSESFPPSTPNHPQAHEGRARYLRCARRRTTRAAQGRVRHLPKESSPCSRSAPPIALRHLPRRVSPPPETPAILCSHTGS